MTARDAMLTRLRGRNLETALEREFYCSQEDYQVDLDMIWYRDWLFVGHDCEVPNPGNYLTAQIGEYPVVVVRDRDGLRPVPEAVQGRGLLVERRHQQHVQHPHGRRARGRREIRSGGPHRLQDRLWESLALRSAQVELSPFSLRLEVDRRLRWSGRDETDSTGVNR